MTSTLFLLMAEFGAGQIEVERCAEKYFGLSPEQARNEAKHQRLPVPAFKLRTSQKCTWLVDPNDLAAHIDALSAEARANWRKLNAA